MKYPRPRRVGAKALRRIAWMSNLAPRDELVNAWAQGEPIDPWRGSGRTTALLRVLADNVELGISRWLAGRVVIVAASQHHAELFEKVLLSLLGPKAKGIQLVSTEVAKRPGFRPSLAFVDHFAIESDPSLLQRLYENQVEFTVGY